MTLVDSSAWIDFFRGGFPMSGVVRRGLEANRVAVCGPIKTELWRGFRSESERRYVLPLFEGCHYLEQPEGLWEQAGDLGFFLARQGIIAKSMDLMIAVYALTHRVSLLTRDLDFRNMVRAGVALTLVK